MVSEEQPDRNEEGQELVPVDSQGIVPVEVGEPMVPQGFSEEEQEELRKRAAELVRELSVAEGAKERELIDNVDDRHGMTATCFYAAGTPDLFEGEKGFTEYEALAERVLLPGGTGARNPRASLVDLSEFPLDRADFEAMGRRIVEVYARAKNREMAPDTNDAIPSLLDGLLDRNPDASARVWVRSVVDALDTGSIGGQ